MSNSNHGSRNEKELLSRVCADEAEAISQFYCDFLQPVACAVIRRFHAPAVTAADLANSYFIQLCENGWRRLRTCKGDNLAGWLWRGCARLLLYTTRNSSHSTQLTDENELADERDAVLDRLIQDETGFLLLDAIEKLEAPRDRRVIRMHYLKGVDLSTIAEELGVSMGTLYVIKSRALARLRSMLEGEATNAGASSR